MKKERSRGPYKPTKEKGSKFFTPSMKKSKIENKPNQVSLFPLSETKKLSNECLFDTLKSCTLIHPTPKAAIIPPTM